jgi:hypothetical protein
MGYCERLGPGLLAEPLNALTNVAFFLAAWAAWTAARRARARTPAIAVLTALIPTIGVASTLFHTLATGWARAADLLSIVLFQLAYLWIYGRRMVGLGRAPLAAVLALFAAAVWAARLQPEVLTGSLTYAPALAMSVALGVHHYRTRAERRLDLLVAGGAFVVAIVFRTIDRAVCPVFPLGTHFVWHLLIPIVAYLYVRALLPGGVGALAPRARVTPGPGAPVAR